MKSKLFKVFAFLIVLSMLLTACGSAAGGDAPAAGEKAKVVIFVGFGTGTDPDQVAAQEALAQRFNESHDDIEIEFLIVPVEEATERYLAMVAGGNAPQLVGRHAGQ